MTVSMTLHDVLSILVAEGFDVTPGIVDYAIRAHAVTDPPMDSAGNRRFRMSDVAKLRIYLRQPRRRGRPPREARAGLPIVSPIRGPMS